MNPSNVFYFKNIVDSYYPNDDCDAVDIQSAVTKVTADINNLSDDDFIEVMIGCFIPDLYNEDGKREKLFTKLAELMVGEWWKRMGGSFELPTQKSSMEDVELIYNSISIVCDAKVFRLGRSQSAPNPKDFLKLASVEEWIKNLNNRYEVQNIEHSIIGGLVTYSSLHEWKKKSDVYLECTNLNTPVVMLPYEVLALLLKYKNSVSIDSFLSIWDYSSNNVVPSRNKDDYWNYIKGHLYQLLSIDETTYNSELKEYHRKILVAVSFYKELINNNINEMKRKISNDLRVYTTLESLREYTSEVIERNNNGLAHSYLKRINEFRQYDDQE